MIDNFEAVWVLGALGVLSQLRGNTDLATHKENRANKEIWLVLMKKTTFPHYPSSAMS